MFCVLLALCAIEAQAYGGNAFAQTRYAYLKLNGVAVWQASWLGEYPLNRGVNMMIVDPSSCTLQEWRRFDTSVEPSSGNRLLVYLEELSEGTVLVGISCDDTSTYLSSALPTLNAMGADVSDVGYRGAFVFAMEKGDPSKTVLDKQASEEAAYARHTRISVTFGRCDLL